MRSNMLTTSWEGNMRAFGRQLLTLLLFIVYATPAGTQVPLPNPQLQIIGQDPVFGPMCAGPLGPGRCEDVKRFLNN